VVYFALVFLFDVGEERRIAEISFSAGAAEFSLRFLFILYDERLLRSALRITHKYL